MADNAPDAVENSTLETTGTTRGSVPYDLALDAGPQSCSALLLNIFEHIKKLQDGQTLRVVAYDNAAWVDVPAWCRTSRHTLLHRVMPETDGEPTIFFIQKGLPPA